MFPHQCDGEWFVPFWTLEESSQSSLSSLSTKLFVEESGRSRFTSRSLLWQIIAIFALLPPEGPFLRQIDGVRVSLQRSIDMLAPDSLEGRHICCRDSDVQLNC